MLDQNTCYARHHPLHRKIAKETEIGIPPTNTSSRLARKTKKTLSSPDRCLYAKRGLTPYATTTTSPSHAHSTIFGSYRRVRCRRCRSLIAIFVGRETVTERRRNRWRRTLAETWVHRLILDRTCSDRGDPTADWRGHRLRLTLRRSARGRCGSPAGLLCRGFKESEIWIIRNRRRCTIRT